jgi:archaeal type IV pilus assembly protein PilA
MAFNRNEEAISPIIGTVLMVAITVIIAAMIGTFVFGVPQNIQKTKFMGTSIQVERTQGAVLLSYHGGPDDESLTSISITAPNGTIWYTSNANGDLTLKSVSSPAPAKPKLGAVMTLTPAPDWPAGKKRVLVVGSYNDGNEQIISDIYI